MRRGLWLAAVVVVGISLNLRPGATSLGPLLTEVLEALDRPPAFGGLLTALPGVAFAIFGALSPRLAARVGINNALWLGLVGAGAGLLLRTLVADAGVFVAATMLAFAGMAVGNVLVPAFIKRRFPRRLMPAMMSAYAVSLSIGATLGSALAVPLSHVLPGDWRAGVGVWGVAAMLAALPMLALTLRERSASVTPHAVARGFRVLVHSRKAVALGVFFGVQSMQAYVQFGWLSRMYRDGGLSATDAGLMLTLAVGLGIPTGLAMPLVVARVKDLRPLVWAMGGLLIAGYVGVLVAPTAAPWLWALALGLSGAAFPMALALIAARTRDPHVTAEVSGFTQGVGYALSAVGPLVVGALYQMTDSWVVPLGLLMASAVVMVGAGLTASAQGYVDDELAAG